MTNLLVKNSTVYKKGKPIPTPLSIVIVVMLISIALSFVFLPVIGWGNFFEWQLITLFAGLCFVFLAVGLTLDYDFSGRFFHRRLLKEVYLYHINNKYMWNDTYKEAVEDFWKQKQRGPVDDDQWNQVFKEMNEQMSLIKPSEVFKLQPQKSYVENIKAFKEINS